MDRLRMGDVLLRKTTGVAFGFLAQEEEGLLASLGFNRNTADGGENPFRPTVQKE